MPSKERLFTDNAKLLFIVGLIAVFAGIVRGAWLGARDFWFDEGLTFIVTHQLWDWPEGSRMLSEVTNLPYFVILWGWTWLLGDSPTAFRSLSLVSGVLTVPLMAFAAYWMNASLPDSFTDREDASAFSCGGRETAPGATLRPGMETGPAASARFAVWSAIICAVIAAFHPLHVHYSREARVYAFWVLCLAATLCALIEATRRLTWRWWALFGGLLFFTLHVHYWTLYWVPAGAAAILISTHRRRAARQWLTTVAAVGAAFVPTFLMAVLPASQGGISAWLDERFDVFSAITMTLWAMMPAGAYPPYLRELSAAFPESPATQPRWLVMVTEAIPPAVLVGLGLMIVIHRFGQRRAKTKRTLPAKDEPRCEVVGRTAARSGRAGPVEASIGTGIAARHLFAASLTLVPLLLAVAYSAAARPVYLVGRYDMAAWPGVVLWTTLTIVGAAAAIDQQRGRWLAALATSLLLACSVVPLDRLLGSESPPSFARIRAETIVQIASPQDLVIAFSYDRDSLQYELYRLGFRGELRSFPPWLEAQVGWVDTRRDLQADRMAKLPEAARQMAEKVRERIGQGASAWILGDSMDRAATGPRAPINEALIHALAERGCNLTPTRVELGIYAVRCSSGG